MHKLSLTIPVLVLSTTVAVLLPKFCLAFSVSEESRLALTLPDYPIVKSTVLSPNMHVPWSKPVRVRDNFEGEFLAVFDRNCIDGNLNTWGAKQIITLWTPKDVRVMVTVNSGLTGYRHNTGLFYVQYFDFRSHYEIAGLTYHRHNYLEFLATKNVTKLLLKVGVEVFQLDGTNNTFAINHRLATALKNAPSRNLDIRLVLVSGETVDSQIGAGTVKAWQNIY